jgi:multiple sugar transport system permease protein
VLNNANLPGILVRTLLWVVVVVVVTMVLSLGLAQLFNQRFPGRRVARWALIAPWAASVMMTALIFRWMLQPQSGVIYLFLHDIGIVSTISVNAPYALGNPDNAMAVMMVVAVFVSLPFTTYVLLAGLQAIPGDLYEAAKVDGSSGWHAYRRITLPLLRPAFAVGTVINLMNVFNSFPIIWEMTRGGPGYETATSTVFMYDLKGTFVGQAAAMSIVNFALVVIIVLVFLRVNRANRQEGL